MSARPGSPAPDLGSLLSRPAGRTLSVRATDGVRLHVEVDDAVAAGTHDPADRPTVILSHGYTLDHRSWVYQRHALTAAGYRVVLWDQRGHGRSDLGRVQNYTVDQLGADLESVVAEVAPHGDLALIGHSMGAMTVMACAAEAPAALVDRVVAVGLVSTSAGGLDRVDWGLGGILGALVNRLGPVLTARLATRQEILRALRRRTPHVDEIPVVATSFGSRVPRAVSRLCADMIFGTDLGVMSAFVPTLQGHDKREAVAALDDVPVLILVGDRDVLTAPDHSAELAELLPRAQHVVVQRGGHLLLLEHPEVVNRHLLVLLDRPGDDDIAGDARDAVRTPTVRHTVVDLHPGRGRRGLSIGRAR